MSDPAPRPPSDGWIFAGLVVLLFWLPLPWGSKPPAAAALLGLLAAALLVARLAMRALPLPELTPAAKAVSVLWLAWLGWCAVHAAFLSIAPGASLDALLAGASYLCLFWLVLATAARNRKRQRLLLATVMLAGVAQAVYAIVMTLSGLEYGFLAPKVHGIGWATGTFVNRNHLAGYLELALAAGIALVLADLRVHGERGWRHALSTLAELALSPRLRTRLLLAVMVIALVLTRSRMGNVALFASLATCGGLYVLFRHPKYFGKSLVFFLSLVLIDVLIVSRQYGLEQVVQRLESTELESEQRVLAWRDLAPVVDQYWLTGAGPGSFPVAFAPYRSAEVHRFFDHAHNDHLEFVIEAGVIGYGLLAGIGVIALAHGLALVRRRRDPMACAIGFAGAMGLTAIAIHGLADFNLHIPAVAATLVALMALMLSVSAERSGERAEA